jgi:hypothetical protein
LETGATWPAEIAEILQQLVPQLELEAARRGLHVDPTTTNILVLGMVAGVALFDPILSTTAVNATPSQLSQAMVELVLHGVSPSEVSEPEAPPADAPVTTQVVIELHERVVAAERRAALAEAALARYREIGEDHQRWTEPGDTRGLATRHNTQGES